MTKPADNDFDTFVGNLLHTYRQFCYWHHLSQLLPEAIEKKLTNHHFWVTTQLSFLKGYLSETAKMFERQKGRFPNVLSIYFLTEVHFSEHEETIEKLKKLRDKVLMHSEVEPSRDIDAFMKALSLTPKNIQNLLVETINVTEEIRTRYNIGGNIVPMFDDADKRSRKEIVDLLKLN